MAEKDGHGGASLDKCSDLKTFFVLINEGH
jgi:hypothetical protein